MDINKLKLLVVAGLAVALVVAILVSNDATDWAVPLLGLLVGYVIGNAAVTNQDGRWTTPVVSKE